MNEKILNLLQENKKVKINSASDLMSLLQCNFHEQQLSIYAHQLDFLGIIGINNLNLGQSDFLFDQSISNKIKTINFISNFINVTVMDLSCNWIADVSPLQPLKHLKNLNLYSNIIQDATPLQILTGLTILNLSFNKIEDIHFIQYLTNLQKLDLNQNLILSVRPLKNLKKLVVVQVRNNYVFDMNIIKIQQKQLVGSGKQQKVFKMMEIVFQIDENTQTILKRRKTIVQNIQTLKYKVTKQINECVYTFCKQNQ
ncbi:leucine-rich_repeat domain-containing protein [Hexamita inflata]|uniref:Leucine-rich repeat domain-containing protein n=1 Tax=Hexamita inflata TaxID=28002 RepID=A0AA86UIW5_9EUKA|nr:leucine-rich repeat domain-containing protein [Hexamita inflata]